MTSSKEEKAAETAEVVGFPCRSCGNQMRFAPEIGRLYCTYCKKSEPLPEETVLAAEYEYFPETDKFTAPEGQEKRLKSLSCPYCGADTLIPVQAVTADCPFCGSHFVTVPETDESIITPETMTPFTVSENAARDAFLRWAKKRVFSPFGFHKETKTAPMSGIYLPAFTFDTDTDTVYDGFGGRRRTVTYQTRVNGKTVTRTRTVTDWYPISGREERYLDDILIPASKKVDRRTFDRLTPFSTKTLHPYRHAYLAGFFCERYDMGPTDLFPEVRERAQSDMEAHIRAVRGYDTYRGMSYRHHFSHVKFKHILLPVWFASYTYRKKKYYFLVNGETAKVAGDAPLSPLKVALAAIGGVLAVGLLAWGILAAMGGF